MIHIQLQPQVVVAVGHHRWAAEEASQEEDQVAVYANKKNYKREVEIC